MQNQLGIGLMIFENRIVSQVIPINSSITILKKNTCLLVCGPLGHLVLRLPIGFELHKTHTGIRFSTESHRALLSTYTTLLQQTLRGIEFGWFEVLVIQGIGWQVTLEETRLLRFSLGYSHSIVYTLKSGMEAILYSKHHFKIFGLDLASVQQTVADICRLRRFNVYKGKGVHKQALHISLKVSSKSKA